jgi:hypothetical protein
MPASLVERYLSENVRIVLQFWRLLPPLFNYLENYKIYGKLVGHAIYEYDPFSSTISVWDIFSSDEYLASYARHVSTKEFKSWYTLFLSDFNRKWNLSKFFYKIP